MSPTIPPSRYLTVREVTVLARCEHKAVRRAIHIGLLQAFQPANKLLVREDDAHAWIQSQSVRVATPAAGRTPRLRGSRGSAAGSVAKLRQMEQQLTLDEEPTR